METLTKLFGSQTKVKLIKLFVFNPEDAFDVDQVVDRVKESVNNVRREINRLEKGKLIRRRVFYKMVQKKVRGKKVTVKVKTSGWVLNPDFEFLVPLQQFLVKVNHLNPKEITKKLGKSGVIKLIILSGIFIQDPESRVDILVVGDHLKRTMVENTIKTIEAEIGKEIRYAIFETPDFQYRLGLYDKLIRDVLDFPHEKILNKLGNI
jgi:hypothetical protein